jgi:hypothetical protein
MKLIHHFIAMFKITDVSPIDIGWIDEFQLNQKYRAKQITLHIETSRSTAFVVKDEGFDHCRKNIEFSARREP